MKTFSDDIVSADVLKLAIREAFNAQNAFFAREVKNQLKPAFYILYGVVTLNVIALATLIYSVVS